MRAGSSELEGGAVAGIVVGAIVGIGILGLGFIFVYKMRHGVTLKTPVEMQVSGAKDATSSSTADVQMAENYAEKKEDHV